MLPRHGNCASMRCSFANRRSTSAALRAPSARSTCGDVAKNARRSSQIGESASGAPCALTASICARAVAGSNTPNTCATS